MDRDALPVNPAIVRWARTRAGYSLEDAQAHFKKIEAWEAGHAAPTYPQLEQMATRFKCPVAVFFFPEPPSIPAVETSFRTLPAEELATIPRTVRHLLRRAQAMQGNLADLNDGKNPAKRLITRDLHFPVDVGVDVVARALREYLGVSLQHQVEWRSIEEALDGWREAFAEVGIYVFKDAFHASRYFGFCLFDDTFPIVYVNNTMAKSRQVFTLFHELGHLLFHTSGIDTVDDRLLEHVVGADRRIEILCNELAAAFLVPDDDLDALLLARAIEPNRQAAIQFAAHYNVSREVIYRKFLDRGLVSAAEYSAAARDWAAQKKPDTDSGNFYNSQRAYLGQRYIDLAFTRYYQKRFDEGQLAEYLNIKPKNLATFEAKFGMGIGL